MSQVGEAAGYIDTQGLVLTNVSDAKEYVKVLTIAPANIEHTRHFHQLTNDTVEKTFGMTDASFEITMLATQPELADLFNLTIVTTATIPVKNWQIAMTDQSNRTTLLDGNASMSNLRVQDKGVGFLELAFRLDFISEEIVT